MKRVYFDSNVFNKLRRNELPEYKKLNELIARYKNNFSFFFSCAHIRDKEKDESSIKFQDFIFMESLTSDNYITYDAEEKRPYHYLATPKMAY